jgi:hypothetical protein
MALVCGLSVQSNGTTWGWLEAVRALATLDPGSEPEMRKTQFGIDEDLRLEFGVPHASP